MKICKCMRCGATGNFYIFREASRDSSSLKCYRCGYNKIECYDERGYEDFEIPESVRQGYKWANLKIGETT